MVSRGQFVGSFAFWVVLTCVVFVSMLAFSLRAEEEAGIPLPGRVTVAAGGIEVTFTKPGCQEVTKLGYSGRVCLEKRGSSLLITGELT